MKKILNLKKITITELNRNKLLMVYGGTRGGDQKSDFVAACQPEKPTNTNQE